MRRLVMGEGDNINYTKEGQGELFPEFRASAGKRFLYIKKEMAMGKKMVLSISWENLVLAAIVLIMLIAVFFSLGVEKGKRLAMKNMRAISSAYANKSAKKAAPAEAVTPKERTTSVATERDDTDSSLRPYAIQVMALKKSDEAQKEIARLSAMGYKAFVVSSGTWYQVCIGRYATFTEANNDLTVIKAKYPSGYIRKLSN